MRRIALAAVAAAAGLCVTSCATGDRRIDSPKIGPVVDITSPAQIIRPIFQYTVTGDQATTVLKAVRAGTEDCMRSFGFTVRLPAPPDGDGFADQLLTRTADYGFFSPGTDPSKGYDMAAGATALDYGVLDRMSPDERAVLSGVDASQKPVKMFRGKPVPVNGCGGAGLQVVGGKVFIPHNTRALPDYGPVVPSTDPRMIAVNKQWSSCMEQKGFHYMAPALAIGDARWRQTSTSESVPHSPEEIATAAADMACKRSVNLVGVVVALEVAYDQQYIDSHGSALEQYKSDVARRVRLASTFIDSHPGLP